jgi:teichuronic acid biosynthesis glycosyltransferase TuaC
LEELQGEPAPTSRPRTTARLRVLVMTRLFPNACEPLWAPYNRQQFGALAQLCDVEVLATVPWFPLAGAFPRSMAGRLVTVPAEDRIEGMRVRHPRYARLPKVGHTLAGALYATSLLPLVRRERHRFDVLLSAWAFPDGVAAITLGQLLGLPTVVKVHGTDINTLAELAGIRQNLAWALPRAERIVAVSRPLGEKVMALGVSPQRVEVVMDGIDDRLFRLRDQGEARRELQLPPEGKIILFVGNLLREKGVIDLLRAFARVCERRADVRLFLVGQGRDRPDCEKLARPLGDRVRLLGARPHAEVATWMAACDLLSLPSWNEGTPSVLLEVLACGRPVVMSHVGGIPDIVTDPRLGELVPAREPMALADALERVVGAPHDHETIATLGKRGDWRSSAGHLLRALEAAVAEARDGAT